MKLFLRSLALIIIVRYTMLDPLSMLGYCTDYSHVCLTLGQTNYKNCVYN